MRAIFEQRIVDLTKALNELKGVKLIDTVASQIKITIDTYDLNRLLLKRLYGISPQDPFEDLRIQIRNKVSYLKNNISTSSLLN